MTPETRALIEFCPTLILALEDSEALKKYEHDSGYAATCSHPACVASKTIRRLVAALEAAEARADENERCYQSAEAEFLQARSHRNTLSAQLAEGRKALEAIAREGRFIGSLGVVTVQRIALDGLAGIRALAATAPKTPPCPHEDTYDETATFCRQCGELVSE